jgi:hypothetical protein
MDEIISHMICAVKVRNAKLRITLSSSSKRHFRQDCRGGTGLKTVFWLVCGNRHNI